jgi:Na+/H+ antiporter NhaC
VLLSDHLRPEVLPIILFLLSALIAFSTGSSWSTMSILLPLVVGLSYHLGETLPMGGHALMVISIGSVLEGSIFGDHCSPISDTTVLSSTATASDHIDHVRTQIPYALLVMVVALARRAPRAAVGRAGHPWALASRRGTRA